MALKYMHLQQGNHHIYIDLRNVVFIESNFEDSDDYCAYLAVTLSTGHEVALFEPPEGMEYVGETFLLVLDRLESMTPSEVILPPEMTLELRYPKHRIYPEYPGEGVSSNDTRPPG